MDIVLCLVARLGFLSSRELFALRATSTALRTSIDLDEGVWRAALMSDWCIPIRELVQQCVRSGMPQSVHLTARALWHATREKFGPPTTPAYAFVKRWWDEIEAWAAVHLPALLNTLRPGACASGPPDDAMGRFGHPGTTNRVEECAAEFGVCFPPAFAAFYYVHDGQLEDSRGRLNTLPEALLGVFGGVHFYDRLHVMRVLPLKGVKIVQHGDGFVIRFASSPCGDLYFDPDSGVVFTST